MDKLGRSIEDIQRRIEKMKCLKNLINSNDIDEETKKQLLKQYECSYETLKQINKIDFLTAGGSLSHFNKLIAELDNESKEVKEVDDNDIYKHNQENLVSILTTVKKNKDELTKRENDNQEEPKPEPKTILLNDVYKLNLEDIKQMTFEEIEHDKNIYNDTVELKRQIIETITNIDLNNKNPESEMLNQRAINYYFEKIELLKQYSNPKELKNVVNLCRKYDQLKITLEAIKLLESIRKNLIYYSK